MDSLLRAVNICGGQTQLARRLGGSVKQAHVWHWLNKSERGAPAEYCVAIETATGGQVSRYELRPDVFGSEPKRQEAA